MVALPSGVEFARTSDPAHWYVSTLAPLDVDALKIRSYVPCNFEAFARVFHPAGYVGGTGAQPLQSWRDAAKEGVKLTPSTTVEDVWGEPNGDEPQKGEMPPSLCGSLLSALRRHTDSPFICWYLFLASHEFRPTGLMARLRPPPLVRVRGNSYTLLRGPLDSGCQFEDNGIFDPPVVWWPEDRSWVAVTWVESTSTYVGGSSAAIRDIVTDSRIEAIQVECSDPFL